MWAPSGTGEAASCWSLRKEQAQDEQKTGLRLEQNQGRERAKLMFSIIWTWISMKNPFSSVVGYWLVILESPLWFYENPFPTCRRTLVMKVLPWSGGPLELAQFPHGTSSRSNTAVLQKVNCSAGSTWWGRSRACCRPWLPLLGPASSLPPITFLSFSSVQSLSCVWLFVTPWTVACQASLSITNSRSLLKLRSFESMMPSNHLILCRSLLLLPSVFPSIRIFSNESALHIR